MNTTHICFASLLLLLAGDVQPAEILWRPWHMELGCVPLNTLYEAHPVLRGNTTPDQIIAALRAKYEDVKSQSFLDYLAMIGELSRAAESDSGGDPIRKYATQSNAIFITWRANGDEDGVLLFTDDLCKSIMAKISSDSDAPASSASPTPR